MYIYTYVDVYLHGLINMQSLVTYLYIICRCVSVYMYICIINMYLINTYLHTTLISSGLKQTRIDPKNKDDNT